ncbi:MAG: response regulator [bacterium]
MKNIMIVEDDKDMQEIYRNIFKDEKKYEISLIDDATMALRTLKDKTFDLIILDIIMEPMMGDSFFLFIKGDEKTRHIPIIVVSVLSPDTLKQLQKVDNVMILQKPITKAQLLKEVNKILV